ncbi:DeoR/GlpR transcriptional regulator [Olivibacter sp. SDN3]|uniref:DeoR/GlpR family DNA-binding transcription regulator n=1 Tax=Olivibacter sp. SDN3 TaxID=2764720 RepID=UPI0016511ECB|nr:DeoR/GlpR family DNA-binding transcription regulator [Olivibacter sp. SDN3]QNL48398.1 DeoR/GlpR transcriptional regulator [Olivibacter sp. SDN3]
MLREERFRKILNQLETKTRVTYQELSLIVNVSEDTIRRDIDMLDRTGLLSKVRGGAIPRSKNPLTFHDRQSFLNEGKEVIALKAQQFLKDGQTVFLDGGTTICQLASHFNINLSIRVVTNNLALIPILKPFKNIDVIVLGGNYLNATETNIGMTTCTQVQQYVADVYFMGLCATHSAFGITTAIAAEAEVKRTMFRSSLKSIALSNSEKLENIDPFRVCDINQIDVLITDLDSMDSRLDAYRYKTLQLL